jgi:hypothetical protein
MRLDDSQDSSGSDGGIDGVPSALQYSEAGCAG